MPFGWGSRKKSKSPGKDSKKRPSDQSSGQPASAGSSPPASPAGSDAIKTRPSLGNARATLVKDHDETATAVQIEHIYDGVPGFSKPIPLGQGGTAEVFKIRHKKTGQQYALKVLNLLRVSSASKKEMLLREIPIMKVLDHKNVIKIVEVFRKINTVYIVMELCTGGELFDKLYAQPDARFSESDARHLATKMLSSLAYLHSNDLVHRDLKLENFIFTSKSEDADIKLIDFGFSRQYLEGETKMNELVGTCYYVAPEVLNRQYTASSDLWSLGVVLYMMVTGEAPFDGSSNSSIMQNIRVKTRDPEMLRSELDSELAGHDLSDPCIDFLLRLLTVDPEKRMTAAQGLEHRWIKSDDFLSEEERRKRPRKTDSEVQRDRGTTIAQMRINAKANEWQRAALFAVAFEMSSTDLAELNEAFEAMDHNKDGSITYKEFQDEMVKHGLKDSDKIKELFDSVDTDGTGSIQYTEFLASAMEQQVLATQEQVEAAFYRLDLDSSGFISRDELAAMLGKHCDPAAVQKVLDEADLDKDGQISLAEFKAAVSGQIIGKRSMEI